MTKFILRRTNDASVATEDALAYVGACSKARVVHRNEHEMLIDIDDTEVASLRSKLEGWIVSEQHGKMSVPDTRRKIR